MSKESNFEFSDEDYMAQAITEANKANSIAEVPIGAVIVYQGRVIGRGYNLRETQKDPTAHAEIIALREAALTLGGWRLTGCDMYVTIEPCAMCTGAIIQSRIRRLVIGSTDIKAGACGGATHLLGLAYHNHQVKLTIGVLEEVCASLMTSFFKKLRTK